ncbi:NUDIX domain-containing protein [Nonomuraea thailandensis]
MRWQVHSEKSVYLDQWLDVRVADVELPDGRHLDHRLVRTAPGAGAVVTDDKDRVLLIWRHRFITDSWAWEIPLGQVDEGEMPMAAAAREVEEETGWRPGPCGRWWRCSPATGSPTGSTTSTGPTPPPASGRRRIRGRRSAWSGCRWPTSAS